MEMTTIPVTPTDAVPQKNGVNAALSRWAATLLSAGAIFWVASRKTFFDDSISSVFLSVALLSIFAILLRTGFSWREVGGVGLGAAAIYWLDIHLLGYPYSWPVLVSCIGIAGLGVLAVRAIWAEESERGAAVLILSAAFLFVASEWCAGYFLEWGEAARPKTLDLYLYSFDASLGVQPAVLFGQWFARFPWFAVVSRIVYLALPLAMGLVFAGNAVKEKKQAMVTMVAFLITGPIGACFYTMFPALGPVHILNANFPWHALTMEQAKHLALEPIAARGPRNAIPSLHAAWIFLVYWFSLRLSALERLIAALFVFFTLCATLGTGEHYFIDLIVAAPFTVLILGIAQGACGKWKKSLWAPLLCGVGMTLLWFGLLRYGTRLFQISILLPWIFCAATIAACVYFLQSFSEPEIC